MPLITPPNHPRNKYTWAYSIEPGAFRVLTGHLLNAEGAQAISQELNGFGITNSVSKYPQGGHEIRVEGAANVSKFDSALPAEKWATNIITQAYDHVNRQPVDNGIALLARHGGGSEDAKMECISSALEDLGMAPGEKKTGRLGPYYAITNSADVARIDAIYHQAQKAKCHSA